MARAYGRSVETEQRLAIRRMFAGDAVKLERDGSLPELPSVEKRGRVGSAALDVLALVLGLALGLAGLHALKGEPEGCRSCVVMTR